MDICCLHHKGRAVESHDCPHPGSDKKKPVGLADKTGWAHSGSWGWSDGSAAPLLLALGGVED